MDADDFGGGRCRLAGVGGACDVTRDVFEAAARFVGRRGDRGRHKGSGSVTRDCLRDGGESFLGGRHHIVSARAVDVNVDETWNQGHVARKDFLLARWEIRFVAAAYTSDFSVFHDDDGVADFFMRRKRASRVYGHGRHSAPSYLNSLPCAENHNAGLQECYAPLQSIGSHYSLAIDPEDTHGK